jgi:hypothetical protein
MNSSATRPVAYVTAVMDTPDFYFRWTLFEEHSDGS